MEREDEDPNAISPMTDEEAELFRYLRFGQLPPPINLADTVASVDTRRLPDDSVDEDRRYWYGGGG